ncbi:MAG: formate dehydrogenase subunit alpha, partial [Desulfobulbaceae bacterium]|nr:formate dehydrogenase subunit alpha [Candidatus Desulfatifera sulfidica]
PCPTLDHPGTPVLHVGKFTRGLGLFIPEEYTAPTEMPDADYPMILTTIRETPQYNFGSMTRQTPEIEDLCPEAFAEINPEDAERMGFADLDRVEVTSRRGSVKLRVKVTDKSQLGTVAIPYHFAEVPVNNLTLNSLDRLSRSPQYKICSVKVEKVAA